VNKFNILKYGLFLKEALDPWKLKQGIKSLNRLPEEVITINGDLKELSKRLTEELLDKDLPYTTLLNFGGIEIDIKIIQSNRYYSNVDWFKFLNGDYEILIEVENNFDLNYLVSTIIHEVRHMIDFTDENLNSGLSSFDIDRNLRKYNIDNFNQFFVLVYISLEHELVARNNQIYPYIKFKNLSREESIEILKKSFIWKALELLNNFDYSNFVKNFDTNQLISITNNFIKDCLYDETTFIDSLEDLILFYKTWDDYFKETSEKWKSILLREVDYLYERKKFNIEHSDNYKDVLNSIWISIYKNTSLKSSNI
jgi:hypothetical protein